MKKLFLSLVAIASATVSFAQSSLLATLTHEGEISTFYGASALRQAHEAAANGDVITLSSGSFTSVDITKAITLRGAGWEVDSDTHGDPTVISGDFIIDIPEETTERLTIEGIYHKNKISYRNNLVNATFLKSRFGTIDRDANVTSTLKNATFIHCRVAGNLYLATNSSATCINCFIEQPHTLDSTYSNFEFINCILKFDIVYNMLYSSSFHNCILIPYGDLKPLNGSNTVYNCIGFKAPLANYSGFWFGNIPNTTNTLLELVDYENFFQSYNGSTEGYNDSETFELTDEAQAQYLGTDGTQVGIYGGTLPFSSTPSNPQITKCNVAAKSTADGKLSVDIEVSSAE